eukprot:768466-Hanusia_phi.AAC.1
MRRGVYHHRNDGGGGGGYGRSVTGAGHPHIAPPGPRASGGWGETMGLGWFQRSYFAEFGGWVVQSCSLGWVIFTKDLQAEG